MGYRFKIILKDGRYDTDTKQRILNFLQNMGEEQVSVTRGTCEMLAKPSGFIWNCYFYTNDPGVNVFLNLISPGIISNCHELVVKAHK